MERMEVTDDNDDDTEERTWSGSGTSRIWEEEGSTVQPSVEPEVNPAQANNDQVLAECLGKFSSSDYIMEPGIFNQLKKYFQAGGSPEQVIDLLSENYHAYAQMANLMAEWVISAGANINEVREKVETSLTEMIVKSFDPKKADSIFSEEGETPAWLTEMIEHPTWRKLVYKLAEDYPDCLMLNFTIKLISDAGYQGEITSISTAAQQIEVFSRMLNTSILKIINCTDEENALKCMKDTAEMICHSEHTFVYSQVLLHAIIQEGGPRDTQLIKRLSQEIIKCAAGQGHDVTQIIMSLNGATKYPRACQALSSMLSRNALNPADITQLYKMYTSPDPPPVDLIRSPQFLELLISSLFNPSRKLNPDHESKYVYLLAYAGSVLETFKHERRLTLKQNELKPTIQALEKVLLCIRKTSSELIVDIPTIYSCIRWSAVAVGVIHWVENIVSEPSYFNLSTDHTPIHLALLDEVATAHSLLHQKVLTLLIKIFETTQEELEILVQLEQKKMLLDRMVHLMSRGCVLPVVKYIHSCWAGGDTDISLIRYFVTEVLEMIGPPYSPDFVTLFLPLVEDDDITGMSRGSGGGGGGMDSHYGGGGSGGEQHDTVSEFIVHCRAQAAAASTAAAAAATPSTSGTGRRSATAAAAAVAGTSSSSSK